jgi:hypothetical protein
MTVVSLTAIHPNPGVSWDDIQTQIKAANDLIRKHGAENVTTLVGMAAGPATATVTLLATSADWTAYGTTMDALMADPDWATMMTASGAMGTWDTYVLQTIPDL